MTVTNRFTTNDTNSSFPENKTLTFVGGTHGGTLLQKKIFFLSGYLAHFVFTTGYQRESEKANVKTNIASRGFSKL